MRLSCRLKDYVKGIQQLIKHDLNILEKDKYIAKIRSGNGGAGLSRFDGCGGRGGSVLFVPLQNMPFSHIEKSFGKSMTIIATNGESATKTKLVGGNARDIIIEVPVGVEVVNEESGEVITRCDKPFHRYLIARGGEGGRRENHFRNEKGESIRVGIHIKLRPNIALLGFPNAGKSTLMKSLVPSKSVKIASYSFTTRRPQVAIWKGDNNESNEFTLSIADLPGVIEGASRNRGKGLSFLKHLQYADLILLVVDLRGFQLKNDLSEPHRSALECIGLMNKEVEAYDEKIVLKPMIIVINKIDLCKDEQALHSLISQLKSREWINNLTPSLRPIKGFNIEDVVAISAKSGQIQELKKMLRARSNFINCNNHVE
ncbi:hypothetical protein PRIPAC_79054 [Pristionchus pacificus]|uniref:50S ribosome-binding GTPase n=1 Tax=Pristionchus pacificus TaxID=54126 RepID=A0A2A6BYV6_PRIPA|nr:hypothetical protein PRIPAC_79054 [Pristionchus pacificus]|eukprot:PDM70953.1 50S ribosome-binding GTPase [Pristionchus pacificus]